MLEIKECQRCHCKLPHQAPYYINNNNCYCGDCSYILGFIDDKTLRKEVYYFIAADILAKYPITIVTDEGKIDFITEAQVKAGENNYIRHSLQYRKWRNKVFARDNYTCQNCGKKGGNLQAHHIKPFAKYKRLRFSIKNGITLCKECHKLIHKNLRINQCQS